MFFHLQDELRLVVIVYLYYTLLVVILNPASIIHAVLVVLISRERKISQASHLFCPDLDSLVNGGAYSLKELS
jgi:hypothetical protein